VLGWRGRSLQALARRLLGVELDKGEQCGDWRRRPLTPAMLAYARADTRRLIQLVPLLVGHLQGAVGGRGTEPGKTAAAGPGAAAAAKTVLASEASDEDEDDDAVAGSDEDEDDDEEEARSGSSSDGVGSGAAAGGAGSPASLSESLPAARAALRAEAPASELLCKTLVASAAVTCRSLRSPAELRESRLSLRKCKGLANSIASQVMVRAGLSEMALSSDVAEMLADPPLVVAAVAAVWKARVTLGASLDENFTEWALPHEAAARIGTAAVGVWANSLLGRPPPSADDSLGAWQSDPRLVLEAVASGRAGASSAAVGSAVQDLTAPVHAELQAAVDSWRGEAGHSGAAPRPDVLREACEAAASAVCAVADDARAALGEPRPGADEVGDDADVAVDGAFEALRVASVAQLQAVLPPENALSDPEVMLTAMRGATQAFAPEEGPTPAASGAGGAQAPSALLFGWDQIRSGAVQRQSVRKVGAPPAHSLRKEWSVEVRGPQMEVLPDMSLQEAFAVVQRKEGAWLVAPSDAEVLAHAELTKRRSEGGGDLHVLWIRAAVQLREPASAKAGAAAPTLRCWGCGTTDERLRSYLLLPDSLGFTLGPGVALCRPGGRMQFCYACSVRFRTARAEELARLRRDMGLPETLEELTELSAALAGADSLAVAAAEHIAAMDRFHDGCIEHMQRRLVPLAHESLPPGPSGTLPLEAEMSSRDLSHDEEAELLRGAVGDAAQTLWAAELLCRPAVLAALRQRRIRVVVDVFKREHVGTARHIQLLSMWVGPRPSFATADTMDEYGWATQFGPAPAYCAAAGMSAPPPEVEGVATAGSAAALLAVDKALCDARGFDAARRDRAVTSVEWEKQLFDTSVIGEALDSVRGAWAESMLDPYWTASALPGSEDGPAADAAAAPACLLPADMAPAVSARTANALDVLREASNAAQRIGHMYRMSGSLSDARRKLKAFEKAKAGNELTEKVVAKREHRLGDAKGKAMLAMKQACSAACGCDALAEAAAGAGLEWPPDVWDDSLDALVEAIPEAVRSEDRLLVSRIMSDGKWSLQPPATQALSIGSPRRMAELLRFGPAAARGLERLSPWFAREAAEPAAQEREQHPCGLSVAAHRRCSAIVRGFRKAFLDAFADDLTHVPRGFLDSSETAERREDWALELRTAAEKGWHPDFGDAVPSSAQ